MPSSTAPAAKTAVLALVSARPNLTGVAIRHGGPTEDEDITTDMIWLGDVILTGAWRTLGGGRRDENYTIGLTVAVRRYGDDEQATEDHAWDLLDEVSAALAADKYLGGLLHQAVAIVAATQSNQPAGPQQWAALIRCQLGCAARFIP